MEAINITINGKSAIKHIMEVKSIDRESAEAVAVHIVSEMLIEKCFRRIHKDEIPSIIVALEGFTDSLKNLLSREESDVLKERYDNLRAKMSLTTMIMEGNDDGSKNNSDGL